MQIINIHHYSYMIGNYLKTFHYSSYERKEPYKLIIATKRNDEPRFKRDKPYPNGY